MEREAPAPIVSFLTRGVLVLSKDKISVSVIVIVPVPRGEEQTINSQNIIKRDKRAVGRPTII